MSQCPIIHSEILFGDWKQTGLSFYPSLSLRQTNGRVFRKLLPQLHAASSSHILRVPQRYSVKIHMLVNCMHETG